jgi:hypothetical protein
LVLVTRELQVCNCVGAPFMDALVTDLA